MEEIRARMEIAERESAAGLGIDSEEMIRELETEFAQEDMKQYVFCKQIVFSMNSCIFAFELFTINHFDTCQYQ